YSKASASLLHLRALCGSKVALHRKRVAVKQHLGGMSPFMVKGRLSPHPHGRTDPPFLNVSVPIG
ncbi:MAG: hypothetical protein J0H04_01670, partial [Hyphomicrobium denitrificans]|nr:hypothetical protein [Hyphomicrobium denitrificans]